MAAWRSFCILRYSSFFTILLCLLLPHNISSSLWCSQTNSSTTFSPIKYSDLFTQLPICTPVCRCAFLGLSKCLLILLDVLADWWISLACFLHIWVLLHIFLDLMAPLGFLLYVCESVARMRFCSSLLTLVDVLHHIVTGDFSGVLSPGVGESGVTGSSSILLDWGGFFRNVPAAWATPYSSAFFIWISQLLF